MTFVLPQERKKPLNVNAKKLLIMSVGKMGKTTILSQLEDCLVLDLEGGSKFAESGLFVDIPAETHNYNQTADGKKKPMSEFQVLQEFIQMLKDREQRYTYIAIDPITSLEDITIPLAVALYKKTPMGAKYDGDDVRTLPNGAGWLYVREAFQLVYKEIAKWTDHLILIGHIKDKVVNKKGEEITVKDLDLSGKLARIVAQDMDAICILYAKGDERYLSFKKEDTDLDYDSITESRVKHLSGQDFLISQKEEDGSITTFWDKIFINV